MSGYLWIFSVISCLALFFACSSVDSNVKDIQLPDGTSMVVRPGDDSKIVIVYEQGTPLPATVTGAHLVAIDIKCETSLVLDNTTQQEKSLLTCKAGRFQFQDANQLDIKFVELDEVAVNAEWKINWSLNFPSDSSGCKVDESRLRYDCEFGKVEDVIDVSLDADISKVEPEEKTQVIERTWQTNATDYYED